MISSTEHSNYSVVSTKEMSEEKKDIEMGDVKPKSLAAAKGSEDDAKEVAKAVVRTPQQKLFDLSKRGDIDAIRELFRAHSGLELDIKLQDTDKFGANSTALHYACQYGHLEAVKLLFELEAHMEAPNKFGSTPLHIAASHGYAPIVEHLVRLKADVFAENVIHNTPVHCSVYGGHVEATRIMLASVPNPIDALKKANGVGLTAIWYATHTEMKELIQGYVPDAYSKGKVTSEGPLASVRGELIYDGPKASANPGTDEGLSAAHRGTRERPEDEGEEARIGTHGETRERRHSDSVEEVEA